MQFGLGYSQCYGIILQASVSQNNFFGTGDSFSISGARSTYQTKRSGVNYYNPYLTDSGIGIGYSASSTRKPITATPTSPTTAPAPRAFSTYLGIPITETDSVRIGMGIGSNKVNLFPGYTPQS